MKYVPLASLLLSLVMIGSADTEMINGSCNLTSGQLIDVIEMSDGVPIFGMITLGNETYQVTKDAGSNLWNFIMV